MADLQGPLDGRAAGDAGALRIEYRTVGHAGFAEALTARQEVAHASVIAVFGIVSVVFQAWITGGQIRYMLQIARGEPARIEVLFSGGDVFWPVLGGTLLLGLAIIFGLLLLIVPGIILALMFGQTLYLIVDRRMPVFEAFGVSRQIMIGNKLTLFLMILVSVARAPGGSGGLLRRDHSRLPVCGAAGAGDLPDRDRRAAGAVSPAVGL